MGRLLLVSANPLFVEVVSEPLVNCPEMELYAVNPEEGTKVAEEIRPSTILVDDRIGEDAINALIMLERGSDQVRILLLSVEENEIVVLSKHKETIVKAGDLVRLVSM